MSQGNITQSTKQISEALSRLRLFNEKAQELQSYSFITKASDKNAGFTVNFDLERGTTTAARIGADNEARAAMCLVLRFFVQPRDKIELHQIAELYRELPLPRPNQHEYWISENLNSLDQFLDGNDGISWIIDSRRITPRVILETFLYGDQAHVNEDKRALYATWKKCGLVHVGLENMFERAAFETIRYVMWLARVNEETIKTLEAIRVSDVTSPTLVR